MWGGFLVLAFLPCSAFAVKPESGMYWQSARSGEGIHIERQGEIVAATIFSYREDGSPVFYTAAGALEETGVLEPTPFGASVAPVHQMTGTLYRYRNGPFFGFPNVRQTGEGGTVGEAVGTLRFRFLVNGEAIYSVVYSNRDEGEPFAGQGVAVRFPFGRPQIGIDLIVPNTGCWDDLRGTWVFVSEDPASRVLERFDFAPPEVSGELTCPADGATVIVYEDATRDATLRCVDSSEVDPVFGRVVIGCQIFIGQTPFVWFDRADIGLERIVSTAGEVPTYPGDAQERMLRGAERVIGIRVE